MAFSRRETRPTGVRRQWGADRNTDPMPACRASPAMGEALAPRRGRPDRGDLGWRWWSPSLTAR